MDLTKEESYVNYKTLLGNEKPNVKFLANCAGFGKFAKTTDVPLQDDIDMIDLNCKALMAITQLTLPYETWCEDFAVGFIVSLSAGALH